MRDFVVAQRVDVNADWYETKEYNMEVAGFFDQHLGR
jgi:hypothetical protein